MPKTTAIATGANEVERRASEDANQVQDACNLVAIVGCWHRHLLAMCHAGIGGDNLINPDSLNELNRRILKESFRQARKIQTRLKLDYQVN